MIDEASGWRVFAPDAGIEAWCESVRPIALEQTIDTDLRAQWMRHGDTWFVGVDALPNDAQGRVAGGLPLGGAAFEAAVAATGVATLHPAQLSVIYPGYPRQGPDETIQAHRFRRDRAAAHLDGLLPIGSARRRHLREAHAYILGIALSDASADAAPLVVWEGSHHMIRAAFAKAFADHSPDTWGDLDVTQMYQDLRRDVFARCPAEPVPLRRGEAVLLHRHAIHGVAPWGEAATAEDVGRVVAYFRPHLPTVGEWLDLP